MASELNIDCTFQWDVHPTDEMNYKKKKYYALIRILLIVTDDRILKLFYIWQNKAKSECVSSVNRNRRPSKELQKSKIFRGKKPSDVKYDSEISINS